MSELQIGRWSYVGHNVLTYLQTVVVGEVTSVLSRFGRMQDLFV